MCKTRCTKEGGCKSYTALHRLLCKWTPDIARVLWHSLWRVAMWETITSCNFWVKNIFLDFYFTLMTSCETTDSSNKVWLENSVIKLVLTVLTTILNKGIDISATLDMFLWGRTISTYRCLWMVSIGKVLSLLECYLYWREGYGLFYFMEVGLCHII